VTDQGRPRVAFLHEDPHHRGGGEAVLDRLSQIAASCARVDLALLFGCSRPGALADWSQFDRLKLFDFPRRMRWADAAPLLRSAVALRRWLRDADVAVCVAMSFAAAFRGALATAGTGRRLVWVCNFSVRTQGRWRSLLRSAALRALGLSGALAVCPSLAARDELVALGYPNSLLRVISNGVELARFDAQPDAEQRGQFRERRGIPLADVVALLVARLDPVKNHDVSFKAVALAARLGVRVALVCLGDASAGHAEYATRLRARAVELGIADRVLFAGRHDDVPAWMAAADVAILSSYTEVASLTLVEAAAARLPLLASRVGSAPEVVLPGRTGYLFEPDDADACARHLITLAGSAAHRQTLGAEARRLVEQSFDIRETDRQWQFLFAELLRRPEGAPASDRSARESPAT